MEQKVPKVQVSHLTKKFGSLLVLDNISFQVDDGEFLCIVGPTGCGKTTFLNSLTKLYDVTDGEMLIDNEPINLQKHNVAYIFQEYSTMPWLDIEENIAYGLKIKGIPQEEMRSRVDEVIRMVGLEEFRHYYPLRPGRCRWISCAGMRRRCCPPCSASRMCSATWPGAT